MATLKRMDELTSSPVKGNKADNEAALQAGVDVNGHARLKKGRSKQVIYRCTPERKAQLVRLADRMSIGRSADNRVSFTETMDAALDALDQKLRVKGV